MRRRAAWTTISLATLVVILVGAAPASAQTPAVSIQDLRVVEGSTGTDHDLTVTLSSSSGSAVDVPWSTVPGSAVAPADFTSATGTVHFDAGVTSQPLSVHVVGDATDEWDTTLQLDEAFFVDLGTPTNATLLKGRATVTIVDDDQDLPGLPFVSAVADGNASAGRVRLQWRVPAAPVAPSEIVVRWNIGSGCAAPVDTLVAVTGGEIVGITPNPPAATQVFEHSGLPLAVRHCYALFAIYPPSTPTTERAAVVATPFNAAAPAPVAWAHSSASTSVVPPTVGLDAVYTVSTDAVIHAMERGAAGGPWPTAWNPVALGKPAHNRSPVVPLPEGSRLFVGTEAGEVHAVDGTNGSIVWSRSGAFGLSALPSSGGVQATPAGLFTSWGGLNDVILVGTNAAVPNTFFALAPATGTTLSSLSDLKMGGVLGMPVVDYAGNRVFFGTTAVDGTLWGLALGPAGSPSLSLAPMVGANPKPIGVGTNGSPVLRGGRLYFGTSEGNIRVERLSDGVNSAYNHGDGEVKGFAFPDRRNGDLYFSTNTRVRAVWDTLEPANPNLTLRWSVTDIPTPSIVLHRPGTDLLYVGGGDGRLYEINVASGNPPTKKSVVLETNSQIGAPSLDITHGLVFVGSATGVVYAVRVPLP